MTLEELRSRVRRWDQRSDAGGVASSDYETMLAELEYHANKEWSVYLPATHPDYESRYMERLASWIGNVSSESDQQLLLKYALHITFFSHGDFTALYRTALNRIVATWVAEEAKATLSASGPGAFSELVATEIEKHTWFCPVTDSLDINEFYKVNHLKGIGHRPSFATLRLLAEGGAEPDPAISRNIAAYMENPGGCPAKPKPPLKRIVLLEDIVGSGTQCIAAVTWAVKTLGKPVLFVPLILCPNGRGSLMQAMNDSGGRLVVKPVVELQAADVVGPRRQAGWQIAPAVEDFAVRVSAQASPGLQPFGYRNTGCSLATFANTPDNTLPLVHNRPASGSWTPLFPRVYRD